MIWGKPVWDAAITPLQARAVRVPTRRHFSGRGINTLSPCAFPSACPQAGLFEEAMFDKETVKGVVYGITIAAAIWLLAWVLGS